MTQLGWRTVSFFGGLFFLVGGLRLGHAGGDLLPCGVIFMIPATLCLGYALCPWR
jgi:hypothetical protein